MTDEQLDEVYTETCHVMTGVGERRAPLFLARLALLLMRQVDDPARIRAAIADAARTLPD